MADDLKVTKNLLKICGRNDWMMRFNFRRFLSLSGLSSYLAHWPGCYPDLLRERLLNLEWEAPWLMQKITVARRPGGPA